MSVNVNLEVTGIRGLYYVVVDFMHLVSSEWHSQNEVGNISILVLQRDCEKLYFFVQNYTVYSCFLSNLFLTDFKFCDASF